MPDFQVTAAWDKTSYAAGEQMTATITGTNTHTDPPTTVTETVSPFDVSVVSDSGAQSTVSVPEVTTTRIAPGATRVEQVFIDGEAGKVLFLGGRAWTVSADRKSITGVA